MGRPFFHLISAAESCSFFRRISRKPMISNCFNRTTIITTSPFSTFSTKTKSPSSCSSSSPWLMLPPSFQESVGMKYNFYIPAENKVISFNKRDGNDDHESDAEVPDDKSEIVGSSHGWLALFNPDNLDLFLSNPLTRRHVKLPSIHSVDNPSEYKQEGPIHKIILSCDDPESPDCHALMAFDPNRLAVCSPLGSTHKEYDEFVYDSRRKLLYCLAHAEIEAWDLVSLDQARMVWASHTNFLKDNLPQGFFGSPQFSYLIAYSDQLFLVSRDYGTEVESCEVGEDYPYKTVGFHVYRIDREGEKLSYMDDDHLDGLVMFVGLNHSFALPASEHPGLKPNSIYFTDLHRSTPTSFMDRAYGGHDIGIFDYENKTISPCYYPCDVQSIKRIMPAPVWFTPTFVA